MPGGLPPDPPVGLTGGEAVVCTALAPASTASKARSKNSSAPSSRGLGRRPLKAVTPVRIRSGLHRHEAPARRKRGQGLRSFTPGGPPPAPPGAGLRPASRWLRPAGGGAVLNSVHGFEGDAECLKAVQEKLYADGGEQDAEEPGEHLEDALVRPAQHRREYHCAQRVNERDQRERTRDDPSRAPVVR